MAVADPHRHKWAGMIRFRGWLAGLLRVRVFVPLVLAAALLALAFSIGDLPTAFSQVRKLKAVSLLECLGLAWAYLVLKGLQFRWLLNGLDARVGWRPLILAFALGEMTIPLPAGVYVQNYVLQRLTGEMFGLTSAATTAMLALEIVVIMLVLIFLPIPGWSWVPEAIVGIIALAFLVGAVFASLRRWRHSAMQFLRQGGLKAPGQALAEMLEGLGMLMDLKLLSRVVFLTALYLLPLLAGVYVVGKGVGLAGFTLEKAASIYLAALIVTLLGAGVLTQLGAIEVFGIGVAVAWGYGFTQGLALLLGFRLVWVGSIWLLGGITAAALWGEFSRSPANHREEARH